MPDRKEITNKVVEIIGDQLGVHQSEVTPESHLVTDFGADSLDAIELVMEIEDEFEISIPDEDMDGIRTVQQVIDYLVSKLGAK